MILESDEKSGEREQRSPSGGLLRVVDPVTAKDQLPRVDSLIDGISRIERRCCCCCWQVWLLRGESVSEPRNGEPDVLRRHLRRDAHAGQHCPASHLQALPPLLQLLCQCRCHVAILVLRAFIPLQRWCIPPPSSPSPSHFPFLFPFSFPSL